MTSALFEQLRFSTFNDRVFKKVKANFGNAMGKFMKNAVARGEIDHMPLEVYWSVAYAPLYNLIRFSIRKERIWPENPLRSARKCFGKPFDRVVKGIKK